MLSIINRFIKIEQNPEVIEKNQVWRMGSIETKDKYISLYFLHSDNLINNFIKDNTAVFMIPTIEASELINIESKPVIILNRLISVSEKGWKFNSKIFNKEFETIIQKLPVKKYKPRLLPDYFKPNKNFRKIKFKDEWMELSPMQAKAIKFMVDNYIEGEVELLEEDILTAAGSSSKRLKQIFNPNKNSQKNPLEYFEKLIKKSGEKPVRYRLRFD
jgi:hypothetical protein